MASNHYQELTYFIGSETLPPTFYILCPEYTPRVTGIKASSTSNGYKNTTSNGYKNQLHFSKIVLTFLWEVYDLVVRSDSIRYSGSIRPVPTYILPVRTYILPTKDKRTYNYLQ